MTSRDRNTGRLVPVAPDTETERYCPVCHGYRPKIEFYADLRVKSGLTRKCKKHHARASYRSRRKKTR